MRSKDGLCCSTARHRADISIKKHHLEAATVDATSPAVPAGQQQHEGPMKTSIKLVSLDTSLDKARAEDVPDARGEVSSAVRPLLEGCRSPGEVNTDGRRAGASKWLGDAYGGASSSES